MHKRVIINADDFGLCPQVNRAIAKAHTEGVVTSATIMANMPAAAEAAEIACSLPDLGIGVHLNLNQGRPLSESRQLRVLLDADGGFNPSVFKPAFFSTVLPQIRNAVTRELAAQIQWVIDRGLRPTHLDSHKHFHIWPMLFCIVYQLARRFEIPAIRFAFEPKEVCATPWPLPAHGGKKKARKISALARINRLQNSAFFKTDALFGIAHMGKIDANFFKTVALYNTAAAAEIMTHPAVVDPSDPPENGLPLYRQTELEALCDDKTRQHFKDAAIQLVHYGQL
ncbi:MAG: carbohydrate deacetylase [Planctomycetota bacterium]|jgi:predicted glycoside hydrolase/deacetylase ChbG (UPF0249 family)